ncbi:uncharacterized protein BX663DRAFT_496260 [Cokeromyces recurvatus]|uniref:uncharacterized protein n=1 Tax=Cokeromyces recurvatus TaxID=90255 RepID=UPI00221FAF7A|nr:uncharacterized protein BX663DRAFT_496260 [Cokeromyces recurvatus]KAI7906391.1 hypothetical protein BX663DRAFT_496260 [Cokeromyces recurvatus]
MPLSCFRTSLQRSFIINKYYNHHFSYFHTKSTEWTRSCLQKMKKTDLIRLAKENQLPLSGTKNDIVVRLLKHQTSNRMVDQKTMPSILHSSIIQETTKEEEKDPSTNLMDQAYVDAFELKLANRRGKNDTSFRIENTSRPPPHPLMNQIIEEKKRLVVKEEPIEEKKKLVVKEEPIEQKSKIHNLTEEEGKEIENEGINVEWVKAFDLKVKSRQRHNLTAIDTLSPSPSNSSISHKPTKMNNPNKKNTWISVAIGSGMLIWYFSGEDGFSQIGHFLSSL